MADITANDVPPAAHRPGEHPDLPPPLLVAGPIAWLKRNFFSSIGNTILTVLAVILLYLTIPGFINWAVIQANFGSGLGVTRVVELKVVESTAGLTQPDPRQMAAALSISCSATYSFPAMCPARQSARSNW